MMMRIFGGVILATLFLVAPSVSHAIYSISSCDPTNASPNTNAELTQNIVCDPSSGHVGVTLNSGADLSLNGYTISCASGQLCSAAVTMTANNSVVNGDGGRISGAFSKIVNCDARTGSKVSAIEFEGYSVYGAYNCYTVEESVFHGASYGGQPASQAIYGDAVAGNIRDNYAAGFVLPFYFTSNLSGGTIVGNMLLGGGRLIRFVQNSTGTITDNILIPTETGSYSAINIGGTATGTYERNYCNPIAAPCDLCVDAGLCTITPSAPFGF